jgi:hypothetical protein
MLTVGTNSYVTLAEADAYIESTYRSTDNLRVLWEALEDSDREVLLKQSMQEIEKLVLVGWKYDRYSQVLQFPRNSNVIQNEVKEAQIENAIGILLSDTRKATETQDNIADSLGLMKNIKRPNLRLRGTIGEQGGMGGQVQIQPRKLLTSAKAFELLKGWLR